MSEAILLLRLEHRHADDLLKLVEQQQRQESPVDIGLLRSICDYFSDYPDQCHHPVEDRVFRKLRARDPAGSESLSDLMAEHEEIAKLTRDFAAVLEKTSAEPKGGEEVLRQMMKRFVGEYRSHMFAEEKEFFPMALATLTHADWEEIEFDLFDRKDPLFDSAVEGRFHNLRKKIETDARLSYQRAEYLRRAKRLRSLKKVASFNAFMTDSGAGYELVEHENGSYCLQQDDHVVIDIPRCDETRAVWCAYYFLAARRQLPPVP